MLSFRKIALLLVAAGSVLSAQAQTGQSDAERRAANREAAMERRMRMDREGGTSVPAVVPGGRGYYRHHEYRTYHRHMHRHANRHHVHRHPMHRHHVR